MSETCLRRLPVFVLLPILLVAACVAEERGADAKPVQGVIVNADTNEPIADAFVIAMWTGSAGGLGHGGGGICFHVESVKTDEQGRYIFPKPEIRPEYASYKKPRIIVVAYKPGYRTPYRVGGVPPSTDKLIEAHDDTQARLEYLREVRRDTSCIQAGESKANELDMMREIYQEVLQMEDEIGDKGLVLWYLKRVEQLEVGYEEAARRYTERLKNMK